MEWVVTDDRLGGMPWLLDGLRVASRHVHRDGSEVLRALGSELVEEAVERGGVTTLCSPDDLAAAMVRDEGQVLVPAAPAHVVDPDLEKTVQSARVETGLHHPGDHPPDGVPVDPHEPADGGLVHLGGEEADEILQVGGVARTGPGEGDAFCPHAMIRAGQPPQLGTHLEAPDTEVEVAPRRLDRTAVIACFRLEFALGAAEQPPTQRHGDHDRLVGELDVTHPDAGKRQKARECSGDAHGKPSSFDWLSHHRTYAPVRVTTVTSGRRPTAGWLVSLPGSPNAAGVSGSSRPGRAVRRAGAQRRDLTPTWSRLLLPPGARIALHYQRLTRLGMR